MTHHKIRGATLATVRSVLAFIRWARTDIRSNRNVDLWLLVLAAFVFTVLGATGIASTEVLSSVVLAFLGLLAVSQLRARQDLEATLDVLRATRLDLLLTTFPDEYYDHRVGLSSDYVFIGNTMTRTLSTGRPALEALLSRGGRVRIVLPDPDDARLVQMVARGHRHRDTPESIEAAIRSTIETLEGAARQTSGNLEIRVTSVLPRIGINGLDLQLPTGALMVQHYEFEPVGEAAPILLLGAHDEPWFRRFAAELDRDRPPSTGPSRVRARAAAGSSRARW